MKAGWIETLANDAVTLLRRMPPEGAGVIAGLAAVIVFCGAVSLHSGHFASRANHARAVAAQETAAQLAAHAMAEVEAASAPTAVLAADTPPLPVEIAPPPPPPPRALPQMGQAFVERFDGVELGDRWYISDGWSNGDWMENEWRAGQVKLTPEGLRVSVDLAPEGAGKPLAGGEIMTNEKFRYGYFEIRMRVPRDPGIITGIFTYAKREEGQRPNEIDIEIIGKATRKVELTYHQDSKATSNVIALPFDSAAGFHTYAFEWLPDAVRWYADGVQIHEETGPGVRNLTRPQQYMISLWASRQLKDWVGELDTSRAPWALDVACVAYSPEYRGRALCD